MAIRQNGECWVPDPVSESKSPLLAPTSSSLSTPTSTQSRQHCQTQFPNESQGPHYSVSQHLSHTRRSSVLLPSSIGSQLIFNPDNSNTGQHDLNVNVINCESTSRGLFSRPYQLPHHSHLSESTIGSHNTLGGQNTLSEPSCLDNHTRLPNARSSSSGPAENTQPLRFILSHHQETVATVSGAGRSSIEEDASPQNTTSSALLDGAIDGTIANIYGERSSVDVQDEFPPSKKQRIDEYSQRQTSATSVMHYDPTALGFPEQPQTQQSYIESSEQSGGMQTLNDKKSGSGNTRKILVKVRGLWLASIPSGRPRDIACFILDRHGNQMPYDRQYWSGVFKANRLEGDCTDVQTRNALNKGVDCLKQFVHQIEMAGQILKDFLMNAERANRIPPDLTDDYLKQWLSGPNAVLIRNFFNGDPEVQDVQLPACLNCANLERALHEGGLLIRLPNHSQRNFEFFNLLSPGRGDTRHTELNIPGGGKDIDVKKSRTHLAFPSKYFAPELPLPKICVFQIEAKLELLLFYRGNNQKRPKKLTGYDTSSLSTPSGYVNTSSYEDASQSSTIMTSDNAFDRSETPRGMSESIFTPSGLTSNNRFNVQQLSISPVLPYNRLGPCPIDEPSDNQISRNTPTIQQRQYSLQREDLNSVDIVSPTPMIPSSSNTTLYPNNQSLNGFGSSHVQQTASNFQQQSPHAISQLQYLSPEKQQTHNGSSVGQLLQQVNTSMPTRSITSSSLLHYDNQYDKQTAAFDPSSYNRPIPPFLNPSSSPYTRPCNYNATGIRRSDLPAASGSSPGFRVTELKAIRLPHVVRQDLNERGSPLLLTETPQGQLIALTLQPIPDTFGVAHLVTELIPATSEDEVTTHSRHVVTYSTTQHNANEDAKYTAQHCVQSENGQHNIPDHPKAPSLSNSLIDPSTELSNMT